LKTITKRYWALLGCLIFLTANVSCDSDPCGLIPCDANSEINIEPPQGTEALTTPSGTFDFVLNEPIDNHFENGVDMELFFHHDGNSNVGFIQIVRTVNLCDGRGPRYLFPTEEKRERATAKGWYVDRAEGYNSAIFGQKNSGEFEQYASMGSASVRARMNDLPYRSENHPNLGIRWQAVTVPVDIGATDADCRNQRFGYYYWTWTVNEFGELQDIEYGIANSSLMADVDSALAKWTNPSRQCIAGRLTP
jgi:hypothetical protein